MTERELNQSRPYIERQVCRRVKDYNDQQAVVSDIILRLIRIELKANPKALFDRVVRSCVIDYSRSNTCNPTRRAEKVGIWFENDNTVVGSRNHQPDFECAMWLENELAKLPTIYSDAIKMNIEGYTAPEVESTTGIPAFTYKTRLRRGLEALRRSYSVQFPEKIEKHKKQETL